MIKLLAHFIKQTGQYIQKKRNPVAYALSIGVRIGKDCRILGLTAGTSFGSEPYLIDIGNHVTITAGVKFITHDGGVWVFREQYPNIDVVAPITIGSNVFIGINSIIMPGVTIGNNCVIGSGSVVTRDIPEGSIAVGVPARRIKSIEEYWAGVESRATFIRSLPNDEKKHRYQALTHSRTIHD